MNKIVRINWILMKEPQIILDTYIPKWLSIHYIDWDFKEYK